MRIRKEPRYVYFDVKVKIFPSSYYDLDSFIFQEDMKNFKVQVEELVKENEDLHKQLNKNNFITTTEWQVILPEISVLLVLCKCLRL